FTPEDRVVSGLFSLIRLTDGRVELLGDTLGATKVVEEITDAKDAALGLNHGLVLHRNGTVRHLGARQYGRDAAEEWRGIIQVAAGAFHSVGLTRRGMVVAAGLNLDSQCRVSGWTNVVAVDAGLRHTVALLKSGRVVATGDNSFGQCDVSGWRDVIEIRCGGNFTVGLTSDFRLLATGDNGCGQCNVSDWQEVMAFDAGLWHTVALLSDGTIVTAGTNDHDQCALEGVSLFPAEEKAQRTASVFGSETELVYIGDPKDGPWFYCSGEGSVIIAFDVDTGKMKATRADLICTYGHPPVGILSGGGDEPQRSVSASKLAKQNKAVFALTGDYFTFGYNADGLQIRRGHVFKEKKDEVGFGFFPDGSMRIIDPYATTAEELLVQGVNDSWVFGPTLIEDGLALDIHKHPLAYNDVTMRTVMASICPYHHIGAAYGSCTLAQVVENLLDYGCTIAYNLDGGRSSMMVFLGETVNRSVFLGGGWRGLQDMVGFLSSDLVPEP
ncbi:MAG: phosphodiester glycosidase family protein, partial [Clostridia bacterium]|nr:phosphodiester glycosidase family protein [Clostridia bacterium]